jgi:cyclic-di-GMP-binding protein
MSALPPDRGASSSFTDARACKEWLGTLPLTNIPQAQALLLEGLRALNAGDFPALERLKCLELARERVAFLQGEQRSRYFGKTLPLSATDAAAWNTGRLLLAEIEAGYRLGLDATDESMHGHRALIVQRLLRYVGAQMAFHASIYRRFEPELWLRLHALFAQAEKEGLLEERVKDSIESEERGSSVMEAYAHVVLLQAAYLSELTAPQMDFVEALLRTWARKVAVKAVPAGDASISHPLAVDLEKSIGARPLTAAEATPHHRVLDVEALSKSLRKRLHGFAKGDNAADLQLPAEAASVDAHHHIQRLHKLWCEGAPPRPPARLPEEKTAGVVWSLPDIHFFLSGGKPFEQPGEQGRELTSQEKQDIEVFGRVRERTHNKMGAVPNVTAETWGIIDEMLGAWRLMRPSTASRGVAIGRVLAMRLGDTAPFYAGFVSALSQEVDGSIVITVRLFPGRPEPLAARPGDARNRAAAQWTPALQLPAIEKLRIPATLVLASGIAARGRQVEVWRAGAKPVTVGEVLERGTDFDRVSLS